MSEHGHMIIKCVCGRFLMQCRCAAPNKRVETREPCRCPGVLSDTRAEALAVAIVRKYSDHGEIAALSLAPDMIREYRYTVLEAAAEVARSYDDEVDETAGKITTAILALKDDPDA